MTVARLGRAGAGALDDAGNVARMRSAVIMAPGHCTTRAIDVPAPGPAEVRIRLEGCGVCSSNVPLWEGRPWFAYPAHPGAPGHEGWGIVDALGADVRGIAVGTRVAALSYHAYAEYDIAAADALVVIPPELERSPVPGEPLGCAMNILERSEIEPGHDVAILGIGFLGALLTRLAANAGARVIALSRRKFALDVARMSGAAETMVMDDGSRCIERIKAITGGEGCDRVIEAVGAQYPLELAGELTRVRGRLVIAGYHQDGPRQVNMQLWNWRGLDVINAHERDPRRYVQGMRHALAALARGVIDPEPLYTHSLPLEQLGDALELARRRPDGFLKVLLTT